MSGGHTKFKSAVHELFAAGWANGVHFGEDGTAEEAEKCRDRVEYEFEALQHQNAELLAALRLARTYVESATTQTYDGAAGYWIRGEAKSRLDFIDAAIASSEGDGNGR